MQWSSGGHRRGIRDRSWLTLFLHSAALLVVGAARADWHQSAPDSPATPLLARIHAELEGLEGEAFQARLGALEGLHPTVTLDALLLRAGRSAPLGLTGARAERRDVRRAEALAWLESRCQDPEWRASWTDRVRALMAGQVDEELRCATLSVVGDFSRVDLAPDLGRNLGPENPPRVREAAREALFRLTGRRFADAAAFEAAWPGLEGKERAALFADEFAAEEREADRLRVRLMALEPREVAASTLVEGPPHLRAEAARAIGRGVELQRIDHGEALALLTARVGVEEDPTAFHAALTALLELVEGLDHGAQAVVALRELLRPEGFETRAPLAPSVAIALARLPWDPEVGPEGQTGFAEGARCVAELVRTLAAPELAVDYERVSLGLDALEALSARAPASIELNGAAAPARPAVVSLLRDRRGPSEVRLAAADAAGAVLSPAALPDLLVRLEDVSESGPLRLVLFGSVARLAVRLDPAAEEGAQLVATLSRLIAAEDVDLRRRALDLLVGEELAPLRGRARAAGLTRSAVERLAAEPVAELRDRLLALLEHLGPAPHQASALIAKEHFDALLDGNHRRPERMKRVLAALAGRDAAVTFAAATRLARDLRAEPPEGAASELTRLEMALGLIAGLEQQATSAWSPAEHGAIVAWALRHSAFDPALPREILSRVVEVHLPAAEGVDAFDAAQLSATFDLTRRRGGEEGVDNAGVLERFAAAETAAGEDLILLTRLRLARARYQSHVGDPAAARVDWKVLLFVGDGTELVGELPDLPDLRLARDSFPLGSPRRARIASALIAIPDWASGEASQRSADLTAALDAARANADPALVRPALELVADLPEPAADATEPPAAPPGAAWTGTVTTVEEHRALYELRRSLEDLLEPPAPPPPEEGGDGESPAGGVEAARGAEAAGRG